MSFREAKRAAVAEFERRYLDSLMRFSRGSVTGAARAAGMDRSNFRRLLKKHGMCGDPALAAKHTKTPKRAA